jgi:hypothetical protein
MSSSITPETTDFLRILSGARKQHIKTIFCGATKKQLEAIFEIIVNYLAGNLPEQDTFKRRYSLFKTLSDRKFPLFKKRRILCHSVVKET